MENHSEDSCFSSRVLHVSPPLFPPSLCSKSTLGSLPFLSCSPCRKKKATCPRLAGQRESRFIFSLSLPIQSFSFPLSLSFSFSFFDKLYCSYPREQRVKSYLLFLPFVCPIPTSTLISHLCSQLISYSSKVSLCVYM